MSAFRRLSHHRHPNKEVALNCMRRYGDIVTVICDNSFAMQNNACHQLRLKQYENVQKHQTQLYICRSMTSLSQAFFAVCIIYAHKSRLTLMDN